MSIFIIILKVFVSLFLLGMLIGGVVRASPDHRNPDINPKVEYVVGAFGLIVGVLGFYYLWFD